MKYYFHCPNCGNDESFIRPKLSPFMGDLWGYFLVADYQSHQVQCTRCLLEFRPPSLPKTPLTKFAIWVTFLTLSLTVAALFVGWVPGLSGELPAYPGLQTLEDGIITAPRVTAYFIVTLVVLLCLSSAGVIHASQRRLRKKILAIHNIEPGRAPILVPQEIRNPAIGTEGL